MNRFSCNCPEMAGIGNGSGHLLFQGYSEATHAQKFISNQAIVGTEIGRWNSISNISFAVPSLYFRLREHRTGDAFHTSGQQKVLSSHASKKKVKKKNWCQYEPLTPRPNLRVSQVVPVMTPPVASHFTPYKGGGSVIDSTK